MRERLLCVATSIFILAGCTGARLPTRPGVYDVAVQEVHTARGEIHATYVRPVQTTHPDCLVVFTTGDAGWFGASGALFAHLAAERYTLAGFSAREVLKESVEPGERVTTAHAAQGLKELYAHAKRDLGLPDATPIIFVGFSRGASAVVFSAVHPELRGGVEGSVAIALTREADYLLVPESKHRPEVQVDEQGRLQLYPALKLLGSTRLAVIQSTHDPYVPSAESRQLLGPDTATLRLYEVEAKNHGFSNARDQLMYDLDDAMHWIEQAAPDHSPVLSHKS